MHSLGIISGTGTGKKRILPALKASGICDVTVVHGRDPAKLASITSGFGPVKVASDLAEFRNMADEYDVVFIASPPFLHLEHIEFALSLRKAIICEKPLVAHRADLGRVIDLVTKSRPPFMVAHHLRHQAAASDIRSIVGRGELGQVSSASLQWSYQLDHDSPNAKWKLDPARGGSNALFDAGVHAVDIALFVFGAPQRVSGFGHRQQSTKTSDTVVALLDYVDFTVSITASQAGSPGANDLSISLARGTIRAPRMLNERYTESLQVTSEHRNDVRSFRPTNLYRTEIEDFCRTLDGAGQVGTTFDEAVTAMRVLFAIEDSVRSGGAPVALPPL